MSPALPALANSVAMADRVSSLESLKSSVSIVSDATPSWRINVHILCMPTVSVSVLSSVFAHDRGTGTKDSG